MHRTHRSNDAMAERRRELASILARGVMRGRQREIEKPSCTPKTCLEFSAKTRLTVGTRGCMPRSDGDER
jgi:hypothetical protein